LSDGEEDDQEKLITKLQIEYTAGVQQDVLEDRTPWDLGLLYLTNKSVWLVNREKQKTHVDLESIKAIGDIQPRGARSTTKFTDVLNADHIITIQFIPDEGDNGGDGLSAMLSASRDVLAALRDQLIVRAGDMVISPAEQASMSQKELMRKLSVLLQLNIRDEEQLSYLLGVDEKELVNLFIERTRLGVDT
jgi:hypothetical protein